LPSLLDLPRNASKPSINWTGMLSQLCHTEGPSPIAGSNVEPMMEF
jgi:hypothetical protein